MDDDEGVSGPDVCDRLLTDIAELDIQLQSMGEVTGESMVQVRQLMEERVAHLRGLLQTKQKQAAVERTPFQRLRKNEWAVDKNNKRTEKAKTKLDEANATLRLAEQAAAEATENLQRAEAQGVELRSQGKELVRLLAEHAEVDPPTKAASIFANAGPPSPFVPSVPADQEFGVCPTTASDLAVYMRKLEEGWATTMAEMAEGTADIGSSMETFTALQGKLHRIKALSLVARVKINAIANSNGPKGPYLPAGTDGEEEFPDFDDEEDATYGPRGTTTARSATDTLAAVASVDSAGPPFGALPQRV